ncbi:MULTISPECIES: hypothetical protein [Sinorhizobium/Ensifer group]|uniref:hypothetical protein n=1 Tax=Sinorhizobium/Ensifer group TaxID=227292 RepID=UPI00138ECD29|nr:MULTISPECIES: hypothetical protein [Sinorhizobium/Ensifer group]MBD9507426.1 hypothetical protein [Ensifer sp. ENS10]MBV7517661.1 hypothetical protein [Ensifer sp. ENS12]
MIFAESAGFSAEMLDGIENSGNHHFRIRNGEMTRRLGNHARGVSVAGLSKLARFATIAFVVKQELNIIPLRQGK